MKQPLADGKVRLVAHAGQWRLYQKIVPDDADGPVYYGPPAPPAGK